MEKVRSRCIPAPALPFLAAAVASALFTSPLPAAFFTPVWDNTIGDWFDPTHWSPSVIPNNAALDSFSPQINGGTVTLSANATVSGFTLGTSGSLLLNPNTTLKIGPGSPLTLGGQLFLGQGAALASQNSPMTLNSLNATGSGAITVSSTNITILGNSTVSNLVLSSTSGGGSNGTLQITGSLSLTNSMLGAGTLAIAPAAFLNMSGNSQLATSTLLINDGTTQINAVATFSKVVNDGLFSLTGPISGIPSTTTVSGFTNSSNAVLSIVHASFSNSGAFFSTGSITLTAGTLNLGSASATLGGVIALDAASSISVGALTVLDGTLLTGGALSQVNGTALVLGGTLTAQNILFSGVTGTSSQAFPLLRVTGNGHAVGVTTHAQVEVTPSAFLAMDGAGAILTNQAILTNNGTVALSGGSDTSLNNGSLFINNARLLLDTNFSSALAPAGTLTNAGLITNATTYSSAPFRAIQVPLVNAGTISGFFFLGGGGSNSGVLSPDVPFQNPGIASTLTLGGSLSFTLSDGAILTSTSHPIQIQTTLFLSDGTVTADHLVLSTPPLPSRPLITGPGSLALTGPNTWLSGSMSGSGVARVLAGSTLSLGTAPALAGQTLINDGIIQPVGAPSGQFFFQDAALLRNRGTLILPTLSVQSTPNTNASTNSFINEALVKTIHGVNQTIGVPFLNSGTLSASPLSTLTLAGGGAGSGLFSTGDSFASIVFVPGGLVSNIIYPATTPYLLDNASLSGPGLFQGQIALAHTSTVDRAAFTSITGPGALAVSKSLTLAPLFTGGPITYSGGPLVQILPGAKMILGGAAFTLDGASILNQGILSTAVFGNSFSFKNGATFTNSGIATVSTSTFQAASWASDGNPANAFFNTGTLTLANPLVTTFAVPFYNTGTLSAIPRDDSSGSNLNFSGGGSASGLFTAHATSASTTITFSAPYTLDAATLDGSLNSFLTLAFNASAPLTLKHAVSANNLTFSAGLDGGGTLTGSANTWTGGAISNTTLVVSGTVALPTNVTPSGGPDYFVITTGPTKTLDASSITVSPLRSLSWRNVTVINGFDDSLIFKNGSQFQNYGNFYTHLGHVAITNLDNNPTNAIYNYGTFGRAVDSLTSPTSNVTVIGVPFHNAGLVDIQNGAIDFAGGYFVENNSSGKPGTLNFAAGTGLAFSGGSYDLGSAPISLGSGGLRGTGLVHAHLLTGGIISPGNSPGTLSIDGDLTLNSSATTSLEIAGEESGQFDQLLVSGQLALGGHLTLAFLNGFLPAPSDSFTLVSAGNRTGTFLPPNGSRYFDNTGKVSFLVSYSPTDVSFTNFVVVPEPSGLLLLAAGIAPLLLKRRRTYSQT